MVSIKEAPMRLMTISLLVLLLSGAALSNEETASTGTAQIDQEYLKAFDRVEKQEEPIRESLHKTAKIKSSKIHQAEDPEKIDKERPAREAGKY